MRKYAAPEHLECRRTVTYSTLGPTPKAFHRFSGGMYGNGLDCVGRLSSSQGTREPVKLCTRRKKGRNMLP